MKQKPAHPTSPALLKACVVMTILTSAKVRPLRLDFPSPFKFPNPLTALPVHLPCLQTLDNFRVFLNRTAEAYSQDYYDEGYGYSDNLLPGQTRPAEGRYDGNPDRRRGRGDGGRDDGDGQKQDGEEDYQYEDESEDKQDAQGGNGNGNGNDSNVRPASTGEPRDSAEADLADAADGQEGAGGGSSPAQGFSILAWQALREQRAEERRVARETAAAAQITGINTPGNDPARGVSSGAKGGSSASSIASSSSRQGRTERQGKAPTKQRGGKRGLKPSAADTIDDDASTTDAGIAQGASSGSGRRLQQYVPKPRYASATGPAATGNTGGMFSTDSSGTGGMGSRGSVGGGSTAGGAQAAQTAMPAKSASTAKQAQTASAVKPGAAAVQSQTGKPASGTAVRSSGTNPGLGGSGSVGRGNTAAGESGTAAAGAGGRDQPRSGAAGTDGQPRVFNPNLSMDPNAESPFRDGSASGTGQQGSPLGGNVPNLSQDPEVGNWQLACMNAHVSCAGACSE